MLSVPSCRSGHSGCVNRLCWNETGSLLASGSDDRKVRVCCAVLCCAVLCCAVLCCAVLTLLQPCSGWLMQGCCLLQAGGCLRAQSCSAGSPSLCFAVLEAREAVAPPCCCTPCRSCCGATPTRSASR